MLSMFYACKGAGQGASDRENRAAAKRMGERRPNMRQRRERKEVEGWDK